MGEAGCPRKPPLLNRLSLAPSSELPRGSSSFSLVFPPPGVAKLAPGSRAR